MFYIFTVVVDKVDNDLKNNDYNRVVQDIKEYNSKPNSEDANNQKLMKRNLLAIKVKLKMFWKKCKKKIQIKTL